MSWPAEYRAKVEAARDAIDELLGASSHESWLTLRREYGQIVSALSRDPVDPPTTREVLAEAFKDVLTPAAVTPPPQGDYGHRAARERTNECWTRIPAERRDALLLDALGGESLTLKQIAERLDERFRTPECGESRLIRDSHVRPVALRMVRANHLCRQAERFQGKVRYRYFRPPLTGEIAHLEQQFRDA